MWIPETTMKHLDIPSTGTIDWTWEFIMWFPQLDKDQWYWVVLSSPCWLCLFPCTGTPSSCIVWNRTTPWKMNRCFFPKLGHSRCEHGESEGCFSLGHWTSDWVLKIDWLLLILHASGVVFGSWLLDACTFVPLEDSQHAVPHGEASISFQGFGLLGVFDGSSPSTDTILLFFFFAIFPSIFKQGKVLVNGFSSTCDFSCSVNGSYLRRWHLDHGEKTPKFHLSMLWSTLFIGHLMFLLQGLWWSSGRTHHFTRYGGGVLCHHLHSECHGFKHTHSHWAPVFFPWMSCIYQEMNGWSSNSKPCESHRKKQRNNKLFCWRNIRIIWNDRVNMTAESTSTL